ncbi:MAG: hypothetical protein V4655_01070 [Bdellovibrionota bacterium]
MTNDKEHSHKRDQRRDLANLKRVGKGDGLNTLEEEQEDESMPRKSKLTSDEVKHH